ncbi:hypothetical protein HBI24_113230 [Parastagonospora nodorum]|nr:hypothetical protein HBI09_116380 [Parastagonospora nodorum]KAH4898185.1 hypothetical protein HBI80_185030 [Parastagonospora nodorum]KAH5007932.1 hypothetical protein HBI77_101400 [Parastagonospora nodorum]KAH5030191.1 hypothetical protein HBI74_096990 [Parastagonospora nodorum]KAH5256064.1 hypothetical protein HBI72_132260 [Parastagonospora nodorum]
MAVLSERSACPQLSGSIHSIVRLARASRIATISHAALSSRVQVAAEVPICAPCCAQDRDGDTREFGEIVRPLGACRYKVGPCTLISAVAPQHFVSVSWCYSVCLIVGVNLQVLALAQSEQH